MPRRMRLAPTLRATALSDEIRAVGRPRRSISRTIVAPQRVPVPQVLVKDHLDAHRQQLLPIFAANRSALAMVVPLPTVT